MASARTILGGLTAWFALTVLAATPALAQTDAPSEPAQQQTAAENAVVEFDIPAQPLSSALIQLSQQAGVQVVMEGERAGDTSVDALRGEYAVKDALELLLLGTGFTAAQTGHLTYTVKAPQGATTAGQNTVGQRRPGIEEIIVTGQKREERIQDVPIAISAFTQEDLTTSQIAGGPDLHLQVPNMTFTKTNFTGYSIQIRGIGTQAISATTDPAVAVALNNSPFIRNNFFEQEFYDLERLEVLRGPQGTLYGRNATAGVVNLITAKPKFQKEAMLSLDKGNYNSRRWEFMLNQPLVDDAVALRIAGAGTKRDGYATNEITGNPIDGRDLWSTRVSLRIAPPDANFDLNLMWERFEEDDDRLRSGKQLCHKDVVEEVGGIPVTYFQTWDSGGGQQNQLFSGVQGTLSQGCKRGSLYSENAFQTPNGIMLPYYLPLSSISLPAALDDPYATADQSKDLRVIESAIDPEYRAKSDIGQIRLSYELTDTLTLDSETAYGAFSTYSLQDFNRFNTSPGAWEQPDEIGNAGPGNARPGLLQEGPNGGIFCDPQLGCSDRLVAVDVASGESEQWSQEFRLSSQFSGPFNFSLGANYLRYDTVDKYYVFANSFSLIAANFTNIGFAYDTPLPWVPGETTNGECLIDGLAPVDPDEIYTVTACQYIDPNPIDSVNDRGHNYFLSKNPYTLNSYAVFGETYYNLTDNLKLTAGLRWSVDKKEAPRIPSQLLVGGVADYTTAEVIEQTWREPTGRLVLDWQPVLDFTDETLIYGSYSHGYKAGGANPPRFTRSFYSPQSEIVNALQQDSITAPKTFDAEFVDAFEVGTKNTLLDGALTLNATAFYYDYEGYQISEIVERSAFNRNFDLDVWGAELETDWWALENFRLGLKLGYQKTRIDDGERAVDLMDRTAGGKQFTVTEVPNPNYTGNPGEGRPVSEYVATDNLQQIPADQEFFAFEGWEVVRPFPTQASSCVLPTYLFLEGDGDLHAPGGVGGGSSGGCELAYSAGVDPVTEDPYMPDPASGVPNVFIDYPGFNPEWAPNNGEGFAKDLGGNELPNAPNYTATITADYIVPLRGDWIATAHTDLYWQSESYWRVFNDHEFSRLEDYFTMNLAMIFANEVSGWNIMAYVKNVTDEDALTGAFLYSDDTGLTTNAFLVEPRLYGVRVTKRWDGENPGSRLLGGAGALLGRGPGEPNPWSLELGGYLLRPDEAPNKTYAPEFISAFDPNIDPSREQGKELDWGDGREIVLTYAPENGWQFSLGARFGESKRDEFETLVGQEFENCFGYDCDVFAYAYPQFKQATTRTNYGISDLSESEEHLLIDFQVGRDVGLGGLLDGTVSAGLRYAHFESKTKASLYGTPDWEFSPSPYNKYHTEYSGSVDIDREFQGVGPVFAWESSHRLFGGEESSGLDLDWSISGGVLFGKQETSVQKGAEESAYFTVPLPIQAGFYGSIGPDSTSYTPPENHERDDDSIVTVPTLGAELGLTYRLDGASIGLGYGWERYYGVIDGGIEESRSYDRTLEGPYLKVTFGGGS